MSIYHCTVGFRKLKYSYQERHSVDANGPFVNALNLKAFLQKSITLSEV